MVGDLAAADHPKPQADHDGAAAPGRRARRELHLPRAALTMSKPGSEPGVVKQSVTRRRALLLGAATLALGIAMQRAADIADASPLACGVPPREPPPFPLP